MTKADFIARVYARSDVALTKTLAEQALNAFWDVCTEGLKGGEKIVLSGFGTFQPVKRAARQGRNPRTGESIAIPEHRTVKFVPGKDLRETLMEK